MSTVDGTQKVMWFSNSACQTP